MSTGDYWQPSYGSAYNYAVYTTSYIPASNGYFITQPTADFPEANFNSLYVDGIWMDEVEEGIPDWDE